MMNYHSYNKKRRSSPLRKIAFVVVFCFVFGYLLRGVIVKSVIGLGRIVDSVFAFVTPQSLRSDNTILSENQKLKQDLLSLAALVADRNVLSEENANLKFLLGRKDKAGIKNAILGVIKQSPYTTPNDVYILDVGTSDGVVVGDTVLFGSLAIGKIVEVQSSYSKAQLFSSPSNVWSGFLQKDNFKIEARGLGGGQFSASVPIGANVSEGDALILSDISPKVFGVVTKIEERKEEGFKTLLFSLPVNPNHIREVIITK